LLAISLRRVSNPSRTWRGSPGITVRIAAHLDTALPPNRIMGCLSARAMSSPIILSTSSTARDRQVLPLRTALVVGVACLLSGCLLGPKHERPQAPETATLGSELLDEAERDEAGMLDAAAPQIRWWRELGDDTLSALITRAAEHNHDIRQAEARLREADALLGEGRFERYPITEAQGRINRQRLAAGSGSTLQAVNTLYSANLDAAWELDFFGRVRRSVEALSAERGNRVAARNLAFVTVAAEVGRSYTDLRGAQHRLEVAKRNAAVQEETYRLTQALRDGGRGTELDVTQARAQLETTRAGIPALRADIQRHMHRLAVLVGEPPLSLRDTLADPASLPALPDRVHIGDAAELLRRRPDVAAAEADLAAVTARIGIAKADYFPSVSLMGGAGYITTEPSDFGSSTSQRWSIGPSFRWAAFDLGRVRARVEAAEARAEAALAQYEQTVLIALEEAENSIVGYIRARQRQERLALAEAASTEAARLARLRFRSGAVGFLTVLDAELRQLDAQDALANARVASGQALIGLYRALGGGWQAAFSPSTESNVEFHTTQAQ